MRRVVRFYLKVIHRRNIDVAFGVKREPGTRIKTALGWSRAACIEGGTAAGKCRGRRELIADEVVQPFEVDFRNNRPGFRKKYSTFIRKRTGHFYPEA